MMTAMAAVREGARGGERGEGASCFGSLISDRCGGKAGVKEECRHKPSTTVAVCVRLGAGGGGALAEEAAPPDRRRLDADADAANPRSKTARGG